MINRCIFIMENSWISVKLWVLINKCKRHHCFKNWLSGLELSSHWVGSHGTQTRTRLVHMHQEKKKGVEGKRINVKGKKLDCPQVSFKREKKEGVGVGGKWQNIKSKKVLCGTLDSWRSLDSLRGVWAVGCLLLVDQKQRERYACWCYWKPGDRGCWRKLAPVCSLQVLAGAAGES